ncbi:MAG: hypothetical protein PWP46_78 [Fusobacteriaceae bacterium]|jgi:nucleotidyltransferase substrate binding protein (TIGR01987 family)|nr:nucleotidyltransferase [Fusobacteriales bacterium]MDN5303199.1 hypothetical protein [Fusobacteriaceae bacterium]
MENLKEIRWKQRFMNYERSFKLLKAYINIEKPSEIERAGGIQFFEMCFELAWKTMKDFLEAEGYIVKSPRETIKQALQYGLIEDGYSWIDGLADRNLIVHTYDEKTAELVDYKLKEKYYKLLSELYEKLKGKI